MKTYGETLGTKRIDDGPQCTGPADSITDEVRGVRKQSARLNSEIEQLSSALDVLRVRLGSVMLDRCTGESGQDDPPRPATCEVATELERRCEEIIRLRTQVNDIVQRLDL